MHGSEHTTIRREVQGIQIPDGTPITLEVDMPVRIAQSLGDTYTVVTPWGLMIRIDAKDADAIGKEPVTSTLEASDDPLEEQLWSQLRTCYDPEIPVNIVDLGLIYSCNITEGEGDSGARVQVTMTLTAPGCGMGQILADDVKSKAEALPGIEAVDVELVFDPPWNQNMMTEAAKLQLGMF
jgi:probable FeS assembly SUF system protein SufT